MIILYTIILLAEARTRGGRGGGSCDLCTKPLPCNGQTVMDMALNCGMQFQKIKDGKENK